MTDSALWIGAIVLGSAALIALVSVAGYAALGSRKSLVGLAVSGLLAAVSTLLAVYSAVESRSLGYTVGYGLAALAFAKLAVASVVKPRPKP